MARPKEYTTGSRAAEKPSTHAAAERGPSRRRSDRALIGLAEALTAGLGVREVLDRVVAAAATLTGEATVHLWLVGETGAELRLAAEFGDRPGRLGVAATRALKVTDGLAGAVAQSREALVIANVQDEPRLANRAWVQDRGLVSFAGVPMARPDRLLGVLGLFTWRPHRFTKYEVDLLRSFASHAAVALENAALFDAASSRLRRLETLREIAGEILQQRDPEALLALISRRATELLDGDSATVYLLDEAAGVLRARASFNVGDWVRELPIPLGTGIVGLAAVRGGGVLVNDYPGSSHAIPPFNEIDHAVMAQPLHQGPAVQGVIVVSRQSADRPFGDADLVQLRDFAVQASIALENARLLRLASTRAERVKAAAEVGQLLASTLDADRILDLIAGKCREMLHAGAFGLFRLDGERLRYARGFGLDPEFMREHTLAFGEGVVGRAARERRSVVTPDIVNDPAVTLSPEARARIGRVGTRAVVGVPIVSRDEVLGAMAVYHAPGFRIPAEEVEFLETLANHAAAALENARLFAQTRRRQETAETLAELTQTLTGSLDLSKVLDQVVRAAAELFDAVVVTLWVADDEHRMLTRRASHADREFLSRLPEHLPYGQAGAGWVAAHRTTLLDAPVRTDPRIMARELALARGVATFSGVPLLRGDRLLGVLALGRRGEAPLSTADRAVLETLTGQAAIAVDNARLYESARQHQAEAVALAEASLRFGATLRREAVVESLLEGTRLVLGETWFVLLVDPATGDVTLAPTDGAGPRDEPSPSAAARLAAGRRLAADVVATGRSMLLARVSELPAEHPAWPEIERAGVRSLLLVPVATPAGVRAILVGALDDEARRFTERDLRLAEAIADRAGTALENAGLFEELARAYRELKTAQEQLVQTEKLRALGEMASGVAHDFNNALAAILGRVQLILRRVEEPTLRRWLEIVERAALDASQTVRRIQEFTRIRRDQPTETVDVNQVVRDAVEITQARWRDEAQSRGLDLRVITQLTPVPAVDGHPADLRQALTNLILNAVDALPGGGTITVATRAAGDAVEMSVADTGTGMSEEVRRRIFEPFFSTKGPQGTGLGLAMVYGIVSRHGGQISVESCEGAGSTFTVRLPAGRGLAAPGASPAARVSEATARILVIDDEDEVRETLADMLRENRHEVVVARHGDEGLERFRQAPFDLVLTDLAMPGISGWQVAQAVKVARPDVPVVLVTGWGVELPVEQLRAHGIERVMTKPFKLQDVLEVVAALRRRPARES